MSLERKKHSPGFRRGTGTSPSRSWTAVVLLLVRRSSLAPRSQVVVPRLGGLACTTILQLHQGSILEAAKAVACPFVYPVYLCRGPNRSSPTGQKLPQSGRLLYCVYQAQRLPVGRSKPKGGMGVKFVAMQQE